MTSGSFEKKLEKLVKTIPDGESTSFFIPRASRCLLKYNWSDKRPGFLRYYISSGEAHRNLFEARFPLIVSKCPSGWMPAGAGSESRYLEFAAGQLDDGEREKIEAWSQRFANYRLLGPRKSIQPKLSRELNICLALSLNFEAPGGERTDLGKAVYDLKYGKGLSERSKDESEKKLIDRLSRAYEDLPLNKPSAALVSAIPAEPGQPAKLARRLAQQTAHSQKAEFLDAMLPRPRKPAKELPAAEKYDMWRRIYDDPGAVSLSRDIKEKTVVIVDDLYQSGVTMRLYAQFLKSAGARCVMGLACVKTLRDTDNQP